MPRRLPCYYAAKYYVVAPPGRTINLPRADLSLIKLFRTVPCIVHWPWAALRRPHTGALAPDRRPPVWTSRKQKRVQSRSVSTQKCKSSQASNHLHLPTRSRPGCGGDDSGFSVPPCTATLSHLPLGKASTRSITTVISAVTASLENGSLNHQPSRDSQRFCWC
jgi:hypothetical protein